MEYALISIDLQNYQEHLKYIFNNLGTDFDNLKLRIVRHQYSYDDFGYTRVHILIKGENTLNKLKNLINNKYNYMNNAFNDIQVPEILINTDEEDLKQKCLEIFGTIDYKEIDNAYNKTI